MRTIAHVYDSYSEASRVVEALDVVQVGDIEGSNVVGGGEGDCDCLLAWYVVMRVILDLQYANLPSEVMSE